MDLRLKLPEPIWTGPPTLTLVIIISAKVSEVASWIHQTWVNETISSLSHCPSTLSFYVCLSNYVCSYLFLFSHYQE